MSKPSITLLRQGELRAPNGDPQLQKELDQYIPYEYILNWFRLRENRAGIENRFLVIKAGTSSGKSITIPTEIFNSLIRPRFTSGGGVICTQPRVLTTIANVKDIVAIPKYAQTLVLGQTIGWNTQFQKLKPEKMPNFLSATIGTLAVQLQSMTDDEIMATYRFIIIDETHERPLLADMLQCSLKNFLKRNAHKLQCPFVVLMSATIDPPFFAQYYLDTITPATGTDEQRAAPFINNIIICNALPSFERKPHWPTSDIPDLVGHISHIVSDIIEKNPAPPASWDSEQPRPPTRERDDILIFLPGIAEVKPVILALKKYSVSRRDAGKTSPTIIKLDSQSVKFNTQEYQDLDVPIRDIVDLPKGTERRVIVSTSVAETGKTFATLKYVIDAGFNRENEYNPNLHIETLLSKPAPQSRIEQRWGRVGRKFPGEIYQLYTRETYNMLQKEQYPEILTSDISPIIIQMVFEQQRSKYLFSREVEGSARAKTFTSVAASAKVSRHRAPYFNVSEIDMLDRPQPNTVTDALNRVYLLGFISHAPPVFVPELEEFLAQRETAPASEIGITKLGRIALELSDSMDSFEYIRALLASISWNYKPSDIAAIYAFKHIAPVAEEESKGKRTRVNIGEIYQFVFPDIEDAVMQWRQVLGDTFFDGAVLGAAIDKLFASANELNSFDYAQTWCLRMSILPDSLLMFIEARDAVCGKLLELGFDPYRGVSLIDFSAKGSTASFADAILAYKRTIYDGFRRNLIVWNESLSQYETDCGGIPVIKKIVEDAFGGHKHIQSLIGNKFTGKSKKNGTFEVHTDFISILDGFIGPDHLFSQ